MQTACTHCGAEHTLKETELGGHSKVQFRCSKCGKSTVVRVKYHSNATVVMSPLPSFARAEPMGMSLHTQPQDPSLKLPATANVILSITSGPSQGKSHTLTQPRVVLGREGADIAVEDPEISRHHCLLEVRDTYVNLKDMDSTNGTFYDEERVRAAMLLDGAEFRIGGSLIRVNFQPK
jgi:predicted RNA-binding Zn-ribbon protein involved in translation (DUF1610 family)